MKIKSLYLIWGKVIKGKGRGKAFGFPTANILLHKKVQEGIYASKTVVDGKEYNSATFIGPAKTFNEKDYKAESFIFKFNKNIYRKWITVKLYKKIRGNKKFNSVEELIDQMKKDISSISELWRSSF